MDIHICPILKDNYSYILRDEDADFTAVIDPGEAAPIIDRLQKGSAEKEWGLDMILNTHHHGDHIAGNSALKEAYGCEVYGPEAEKDKIDGLDHLLKEGDTLKIGALEAQVIETPGHTLGHICFYIEALRALFAGDTLFSLGCGRLFEGTPAQMFESIAKLKALPDETRLYCGHEYTMSNADFAFTLFPKNENLHLRAQMVKTLRAKNRPSLPVTLGLEKLTNPFCLAETVEEFADFRARKDAA